MILENETVIKLLIFIASASLLNLIFTVYLSTKK